MTEREAKGFGQRLMEWPPLVAIYESRLWRRSFPFALAAGISFDREIELIGEAAELGRASRVLDLACGSGIYTRPFARRIEGGRVVGLDLSRPMLAEARRRSAREGLANVDLVRGSALDLPFRAASFEVVNCCGALHLFPDPDRALRQIQRVLVPGGRFTAAVIRRGESPRERRNAERQERTIGVHAFGHEEILQRIASAGLARARILHEGRIWMLVTTEKPTEP